MNLHEYLTKIEKKAAKPQQAIIRESECIGCMKCLHACPVDAIVGAAKQMHAVIATECTGCELCVEPCPVDCIDMLPIAKPIYTTVQVRNRFEAKSKRLSQSVKAAKKTLGIDPIAMRKAYIAAALARVKARRNTLIPR